MYLHIFQKMEYFISPLKTNKDILTSSSLCLPKNTCLPNDKNEQGDYK